MAIQYELFVSPVAQTELVKFSPEIRHMVNEAFATQDRSYYGTEEMFPHAGNLLPAPDTVVKNLGDIGFAAVAFDIDEATGRQPVAISCIKPWAGRALAKWEAMVRAREHPQEHQPVTVPVQAPDSIVDWELVCVASKNDPKFRRQGLVKTCMAMVEQHLVEQHGKAKKLNLWVTALEQIGNVEFYESRGFSRQGESDAAYAGVWDATGPFKIAHLKKVLGNTSE